MDSVCHSLFSHSPTDGHLGCFKCFASSDNFTISNCMPAVSRGVGDVFSRLGEWDR
jgi:hypothetical protein